MIASNMTPREELNLHGSLTLATCDRLVALHEALNPDKIQEALNDVHAALFRVGSMEEIELTLREFHEDLRGESRARLEDILESFADEQERLVSQVDAAIAAVARAENMLGDLEDLT